MIADVDPEGAGFDPVRLERLGEHFETRYVSPGRIPGCQIAVSRWGKTAYWRSLGLMDVERSKPVADDTIWRLYSMTKPITSIALMQLYEQGAFQLADPLHRYIPEWRRLEVAEVAADGSVVAVPAIRPPTVRDALTHMTGLAGAVLPDHPIDVRFAEELAAARHGMTLEGMCSLLARFPLKFQPGTHWNYGVSTDVCARLVEILSGLPFDEYLRTNVFDPLGMTDTGYVVPDASLPRFAACYTYRPGGTPKLADDPEQSPHRRRRSFTGGASGLVSTTADYVRFSQMLANRGQLDGQRVIGRKTLELMTVNHLPGDAELGDVATGGFGEAEFPGVGFGLGFAVGRGPGPTGVAGSTGEFYWGGAASTAFWVDPVEDLTVVFMTQLLPSVTYPFRAQLRALVYQALAD